MKYTVLLIILITNILSLKAGKPVSFWPVVDHVSNNLMSQLEFEHNTNKSKKRLSLLVEILNAHAEKTKNKILLGRALYWKTIIHPSDSSEIQIKKALYLIDSVKSPYDYSRVMLQQAILQYHHSEYLPAFITFYKKAPFFAELGDTKNAARCYANMGLIFMELEEFENAITYLQKADTLFGKLKAEEEHFFCKKDLALCWGSIGNREKARKILKVILHKDLSQINNIKLRIACLFAYCDYLDNIKDEKTYILEAYQSALKTNDAILIRIAVLNMGWLNLKQVILKKLKNELIRFTAH